MNRLLFLAPVLLSIILSNSTQAAVVANFDITNRNFTPGTKTVTPVTNNSSITGTAVLDSAGIFTLDTVINVVRQQGSEDIYIDTHYPGPRTREEIRKQNPDYKTVDDYRQDSDILDDAA